MSKSEKGSMRKETKEYKSMNGNDRHCKGGILRVDSAIDKVRKTSNGCKASEIKFNYFCKNSCAGTNMTFQRTPNF